MHRIKEWYKSVYSIDGFFLLRLIMHVMNIKLNHTYFYILLRKLNFLIPMVDFAPTVPVLLGKSTPMSTIPRI
jgi:hypothetical protein